MLPVFSSDASFGNLLNPVGDQRDIGLVECLLQNHVCGQLDSASVRQNKVLISPSRSLGVG